jgi:glycosyltransferase involved in cell wall biosynthesis
MNNKKIVHLTSVHLRYDIRIFQKECISLSKAGYNVTLIVADGKGNEVKNGIKIIDVVSSLSTSRLVRILKFTRLVYIAALKLEADLYHFHDPELIPVGLKLKKAGKKVIYDIHEDLPRQTLSKDYIPKLFRVPLSAILEYYENNSIKQFEAIITATPFIYNRVFKLNEKSVNINNFPITSELIIKNQLEEKENAVCFVGAISRLRGVNELVKAAFMANVKLYLAGRFTESDFEHEVKNLHEWNNVVECGQLDREQVANLMAKCIAGIVTFLPAPNHCNAQPNKMFEYMSAGLPVICSNFPLWKEIIEINECGICVNPSDPKSIADGIKKVATSYKIATKFGKNGEMAIIEKYNWEAENRKLIDLYKNLI